MSFERIKLTLYNAQQAHAELARVWQIIKPWLMAGHRLYIEIRAETRTLKQNNVIASLRKDFIRFSPHFYNSADDIDRGLAAIKAAL